MIHIDTIDIVEFRGIRKLNLKLDKKNYGICGSNGTGKSGVVDAIEFCLTGDVTRLSGQGSAGLSVKNHAPHVDQHDHPENATVTISAMIPSLNKSLTIHRSVKNPRKVKITPNNDDSIKNAFAELTTHPEFALSRREIVKYIITPPGKRSEDVQTLLKLDHLEKLRKSFTTFKNKCVSEAEEADRNQKQAEIVLKNGLELDKLERSLVVDKVNEFRKLLLLPEITELTKDTSFKDGITAPEKVEEKPKIRKVVAVADLTNLQAAISESEPLELSNHRASAKTFLDTLKKDEKALALVKQYNLVSTGIELLTDNTCPLCDTVWDTKDLREYLTQKLLSAKETEQLLSDLRANINNIVLAISVRIQAIEKVIQYCGLLDPTIDSNELVSYLNSLKNIDTSFKNFLKDHTQIDLTIEAVDTCWWELTENLNSTIDKCKIAIQALPDVSAEDKAKDILIVSQERYEKILQCTQVAKEKTNRRNTAENVLMHYNSSCTTVLESIYDQVAEDFSKYYQFINHDEKEFVGELKTEPAKLSFDVDFYGRGFFPPAAYHSEGHQDGMGLCLYLALMKHTLGSKFTFAVLDDVLMSVDAGHRREVCRLLKSEFPKTQFISELTASPSDIE